MNKETNTGFQKTTGTLRYLPEVEVEQMERILEAFEDFIYEDDSFDIAYTWKEGYFFLTEAGESDFITTGEAMCGQLLYYLESYFREQHGIGFEDERLPKRYHAKFLQYARIYMDQLPEYGHFLNPYRRNSEQEDNACVIYLNF